MRRNDCDPESPRELTFQMCNIENPAFYLSIFITEITINVIYCFFDQVSAISEDFWSTYMSTCISIEIIITVAIKGTNGPEIKLTSGEKCYTSVAIAFGKQIIKNSNF